MQFKLDFSLPNDVIPLVKNTQSLSNKNVDFNP